MKDFLWRLMITALALWVAVSLVEGIHWDGEPVALLGVALVFGLVNAFLKPLLTLLTCPLVLLTFGLFTLVLNALMLMATARFSQDLGLAFRVDGFWPAFWGGLVIGISSALLTTLSGTAKEEG